MTVRASLRKSANFVFRDTQPKLGQKRRTVLLIVTAWKVDLELVQREIERISTVLSELVPVKRAMHANRMITFVMVTEQSIPKVAAHLSDETAGMSLLENHWVMPASDEIVAREALDALQHHVHEAWVSVRDHNNPPRRPSRGEIIQHHVCPGGDIAAAVKAGLRKHSA